MRASHGRRSACGTSRRARPETRARQRAPRWCRHDRSSPAGRACAHRRRAPRWSIAPCPTAGRNSSHVEQRGRLVGKTEPLQPGERQQASHRPRRHRACAAASRHCRAAARPTRSGRSRFTIACRRSDAVPTTAPCGSSRRLAALRLMKASRTSSRGRHAASISPSGSTVGMSLAECTARSIAPAEQRLLDLLGEQALAAGLATAAGPGCGRPRCGSMTISIASSRQPCAAASAARTMRACASASGLPRVPMRSPDCVTGPHNATPGATIPSSGALMGRYARVTDFRRRGPRPDGMLVLGIETTCDETAAAVVRRDEDGRGEILSNIVLSQTAEHAALWRRGAGDRRARACRGARPPSSRRR